MKIKNKLLLVAVLWGFVLSSFAKDFRIEGSQFLLDGKPIQLICGEMHYPRVAQEYWRDRIRRAKAMGINTISTYVFWNIHERRPGVFDFEGQADLRKFIRIAGEEGMHVVLRPGPYVCAEWDFGGYPYWLQKNPQMVWRSNDAAFLEACERYIMRLGKELADLTVTKGGPILLVQVENEYGSYSNDRVYLGKLRDFIVKAGFDVPLITCDGAGQMPNGYLEGTLPTVNGAVGSDIMKAIDRFHPGGPYFVAEFYPAWFDVWGKRHSRRDFRSPASQLDWMLEDVSAVLINSRKFGIKAVVTLELAVEELKDQEVPVAAEGIGGLQVKTCPLSAAALAVRKRDTCRVKDEIILPANKPNIRKVIWQDVALQGTELRLGDGEISVKGELVVFLLYESEEDFGKAGWLEQILPFNSRVDAAGCGEGMLGSLKLALANADLEIKPDYDGELRVINIDALLELDIRVYQEEKLDMICDLYHPALDLAPEVSPAVCESLLLSNASKCRVSDRLKTGAQEPSILQLCHGSGEIRIDGVPTSQMTRESVHDLFSMVLQDTWLANIECTATAQF